MSECHNCFDPEEAAESQPNAHAAVQEMQRNTRMDAILWGHGIDLNDEDLPRIIRHG